MKLTATSVALAVLVGSAAAFAPNQHHFARSMTAMSAAVEDMAGATKPLGFWDPLGLATMGSESTLAWFRASEIKHSRIAMVANVGFIVNALGLHFPGMLSSDVSFESLAAMKPFDAWVAMPPLGQYQIIGTIFLAELVTEARKPHYMKGGPMPYIVFPPIDFAPSDPVELKKQQDRELNNGRLAMIAMMSYIAEANVHGSVPLLANLPYF